MAQAGSKILCIEDNRETAAPKLVNLNDREIQTLTWVARGKTSAEISKILGLAKRTVDFHIDNARIKFGVPTRVQAAIKAVTARLIEP